MSSSAKTPAGVPRYGSDLVVDLLRAVGIEHVALNPGATFRGLHDSLVNYGGKRAPELDPHHARGDRRRPRPRLRQGEGDARWPPSSTTSSASSTRAWPSSTPSATAPRSSCSAPPARWTPRGAGRGSTGSTPRSCRARRSATTSSWTTSPRAWPPFPRRSCAPGGSPGRSRRARSTCVSTPRCRRKPLERPIALPDVARFQPATPPHADPRAIDDAARQLVEARFPVIVVEIARPPARRGGAALPARRAARRAARRPRRRVPGATERPRPSSARHERRPSTRSSARPTSSSPST